MKQVKTLALLITMVLSSVVLNAQALTQTYDRMGMRCKYPSGFQATCETVEEGINAHIFVDNEQTPKNGMIVVEIKQNVLKNALEEEGISYEEILDACVEVLVGLQNESLGQELKDELGLSELNLEDWNFDKWQLERLNIKGINFFEMSLEEIAWALTTKIFDWGINALYDVTFDIVYQSIKLGLLDKLSAEEGVKIKVSNLTNNYAEFILWDDTDMLNCKLHKVDNKSVTLLISGVIDGEYGEMSFVLYKANENTLALSAKISADDMNAKASAKLSKVDNNTFAFTFTGQDIDELIGEDLHGIQFAKGVISLRNNNFILAGWAGDSTEKMSLFDAMYKTIMLQDNSYSPLY